MNDYFCIVVENFPTKIKPQPNPLLSNEYTIVENKTRFEFVAIDVVVAKRNLSKMQNSFGSDDIASHFNNIAFPHISQPTKLPLDVPWFLFSLQLSFSSNPSSVFSILKCLSKLNDKHDNIIGILIISSNSEWGFKCY